MKRVKTIATGLLLLGQTISGAALAASVTLAGSTVDFTFDDALLGLFGPANLSGDTLYFTPIDFEAKSLNGAGFALTHETINIQIAAHEGWTFATLDLVEKGDYLLRGKRNSADVGGQIRVFDTEMPLIDVSTSILPSASLSQKGLPTHNWTALASTDLSGWDSVQTINVTVESLLLSNALAPSSLAFVEKKFVGLTPIMESVTPVPEAETYAMMLAGLGLVGFAAARRRATSK
jgi:hypothetical protein